MTADSDHAECIKDFQRERDLRDAYQAAFGLLKHDVESFLYKANMTPPWESAGAVWGQMVQRLNNGLNEAVERVHKTQDRGQTKCDREYGVTEDTYGYCGREIGHEGKCGRGTSEQGRTK